jgi:hypothetical protein
VVFWQYSDLKKLVILELHLRSSCQTFWILKFSIELSGAGEATGCTDHYHDGSRTMIREEFHTPQKKPFESSSDSKHGPLPSAIPITSVLAKSTSQKALHIRHGCQGFSTRSPVTVIRGINSIQRCPSTAFTFHTHCKCYAIPNAHASISFNPSICKR